MQQIRLDMRNLVLWQRTFELNREQILSAATQLESAEEDVRVPVDVNPAATLALLQALNVVLSARNALIQTWVSYETTRLSLYRDFDLMDIDANGVWTNENDQTAINIALRHAQSRSSLQPHHSRTNPRPLTRNRFRQHVLHRRRARPKTQRTSRRRNRPP